MASGLAGAKLDFQGDSTEVASSALRAVLPNGVPSKKTRHA
jgi:hypothetical protein